MKQVLIAVLLAISAGITTSAATASAPPTVHAIVWQGRTVSLATLDAMTLEPRRRLVPLGRANGSVLTDRLGDRLAVASAGVGVAIVDMRRPRVVRRFPRGPRVRAVSWLSPSRLLVAEHGAVHLLDADRRRVLARTRYEGNVVHAAIWRNGLVLLAESGTGAVEAARLMIVSTAGRVRTVELSRIQAGTDGGENNQGPFRTAQPALAVDQMRGKAYVAGGLLVASVDLATLAVSYQGSERTIQKLAAGPRRSAAWLGGGILAVSGSDETASGDDRTARSTPFGLRYVRAGQVRMIDERATEVIAAAGLALAYDQRYGSPHLPGMGLAAYDSTGALRWHLFGDAPVSGVQVANGFAYAWAMGAWKVVELATGSVVSSTPKRRWDFFQLLG